ncbi:MAG: hypothetical protein HC775_12580 [Hyellaceae cyanobacterium CSU_1_1]|nr:hypothetical protein [Hyellaceae cyanobacterium CSU_1_1]
MSSDSSSLNILAVTTDANLKSVDLTNCDREPIHIPNLIQPHGVLLAICADTYKILQVSLNTQKMLGVDPQRLLNQPLTELLGEKQVTAIEQGLAGDFDYVNPLPIKLGGNNQSTLHFDGIVHRNGTIIILELEPNLQTEKANFDDFYRLVKRPINRIQRANSLTELCDAIAQEIKSITGFDRVMVYHFDDSGAGTVIAEAAEGHLEPFLNLRYPATDIPLLLPWLETQFNEEVVYETTHLVEVYPNAASYTKVASGLLALLISRVEKTLIIWFRPEVLQTIDWGGNPHKAVEIKEDGTLRMSPRKSFAKWQETVMDRSLPWLACELEAALELRSSIVGIVLRKADELAQVNKELSRSNVELDAFAYIASHDLKEPLRGIYNYASFLIEDYGEILGEDGADKLNTLMRLTHRMEDLINSLLHYSRLGRSQLQLRPIDLNNLIAGVLDVIKASARDTQVEFNIPRPLPTINCDRTQVNELFTNLISNGIKYNQQVEKVIEIGYLDATDPVALEKIGSYPDHAQLKTIFYVRDNGIGIREKHLESIFRIFKRLHGQNKYGGGTGAGLTIAQKIVERHGGEIWVKSIYQEGSTFYFTLQ